jgi:hypothetical protein
MTHGGDWILTLTRENEAGREIGRYPSRDDAMLTAESHFESQPGAADDELGWQMSFNGATALSRRGTYRVKRR